MFTPATTATWNREPPTPTLPDDIVEKTADRYREACTRLTGNELQRF
jgi:phosphoribosylaminoimidazole-succinocarboxamide synthase